MTVPYTFAGTPVGTKIPLSELDDNFNYVEAQINSVANSTRMATTLIPGPGSLENIPVSADFNVLVGGFYSNGDSGGGLFFGTVGLPPGTFTNIPGITVVPVGGDGSAAWRRCRSDYFLLSWFGAKGDGVTNDSAAIQSALNLAFNNKTVYLMGTSGSRFYCASSITVPGYGRGLAGLGWLGETGFNGAQFSALNSTILLGPGATINCSESSFLRDLHIFPYGMTFPQSNSSSWVGTAVTINEPAVTLERLFIVGFNQAVAANSCARLFCTRVLFDCNNGIYLQNSADVSYLEYCQGWPWASAGYTGPIATLAQQTALWGRSGVGFNFSTQNDGGKVSYCFAFAYTVGFRITNISGMQFVGCLTDGPADPVANYTGVLIEGGSDFNYFTSCNFVAQGQNVKVNLNDNTRNVFFEQCLVGASAFESVYILAGTVTLTNVTFLGGTSAVNLTTSTCRLNMDFCAFINQYTVAGVNNSGASPYVRIGNNNNVPALSVPLYLGSSIIKQVASAASPYLQAFGNYFQITGTTSISEFTGGWPGRVVTLEFSGVVTLTNSASLMLAGGSNFTTAAGDTLTLISYNNAVWAEVSRTVQCFMKP